MKTIKLVLVTFVATLGLSSCSSDGDDTPKIDVNPMAEFNLISNIAVNGHSLKGKPVLQQDTTNFLSVLKIMPMILITPILKLHGNL